MAIHKLRREVWNRCFLLTPHSPSLLTPWFWTSSLQNYKKLSFFLKTTPKQQGEGTGNPLLHSCLENPVDRESWWAAVHRVAQSRTRLKRLSMHACIGEGNGNPLQYSCLENLPGTEEPGGFAVYGVAQSRTQLKRLSSSSQNNRCELWDIRKILLSHASFCKFRKTNFILKWVT